MRVKIAGTGKCLPGTDVPGRVVTNEEIVRILLAHKAIKPGTDRPWLPDELIPQKIVDLVGIRERRWVDDGVNTSDLAFFAAEKALADAGIGWQDIGILVVGSSTPEALFPSTACMVLNKAIHKKIAAGELDDRTARTALRIPAFDVLAACTSGLYAVDIVRKHLLDPDNEAEYGLAMGAEVLSRLLDFSDTNADLWGDGSAAVVLKRTVGVVRHRLLGHGDGHDERSTPPTAPVTTPAATTLRSGRTSPSRATTSRSSSSGSSRSSS